MAAPERSTLSMSGKPSTVQNLVYRVVLNNNIVHFVCFVRGPCAGLHLFWLACSLPRSLAATRITSRLSTQQPLRKAAAHAHPTHTLCSNHSTCSELFPFGA